MNKYLINLAPTGMVPQKKDNPNVPITVKEIVTNVLTCAKIGINIVHLHARDENGQPTWKKDIYARIISGIREKNEQIIICVSTSGRLWSDFTKRSQVLELKGDLKPDMASLTLGSMNFIRHASTNSPDMIKRLAYKMAENKIKPEIEAFEPGMIHAAKYLMNKGIINKKNPYFNLFVGSLGTSPFDALAIASMVNILPADAIWAMTGIGSFQLDGQINALSLGGGIRVGLEDNIYFDKKRKKLAKNQELVARIKQIANKMELSQYSFKETQKILNLN